MTTQITSIQSPPGEARERRRPGRFEYTNHHLIALLRNSGSAASGPGDRPVGAEDQDELGIDADEAASLSGTISLLDGASQVGSPHRATNPEHDSMVIWPGSFLANQVCYVAGMRLATPKGTVLVEDLTVGDVILTVWGDRRVTWIRQFNLNPAAGPHPERTAAVGIRRDAIAPGLPGQDLWVSPTHCLWVENRIVPARLLINGMTVVQDLEQTAVVYRHVLYDRSAHGHLAASSDRVAPIWNQLAERAARLGYVRASPGGAAHLGLQLLIDGKPVQPMVDGSRQVFVVPPGRHVLHLASRNYAAVVKIAIIATDVYEVIQADHPGLLLGWGPCEREGAAMWRCIMGLADLPTGDFDENSQIVVYLKT